ncbi:hypothetical protein [Siccibacter colletis]|uniref:hypothetical protein n=1 Tax=Siccibacter colletis TaxID=1505757 RepID=UPI003CE72D68
MKDKKTDKSVMKFSRQVRTFDGRQMAVNGQQVMQAISGNHTTLEKSLSTGILTPGASTQTPITAVPSNFQSPKPPIIPTKK